MAHVRFVIFDCWGTLFDNRTAYLPRIAERLGKSMRDYEFLKVLERSIMMTPVTDMRPAFADLVRAVKGKVDADLAAELHTIFQDAQQGQAEFPETAAVLHELHKEFQLGMITNSSRPSFERLKQNTGLIELFQVVLPSFQTGLLKPDPAIFERALAEAGVAAEEAVMVGDSLPDDIQAAEACGIRGILIDRRNRYPEVTEKITDLRDLPALL